MPTKTSVQCFLSAADCLNFTQVAESLYFSRQAVSQHIAKLEKELGVTLFTRSPLALTPEGELFAAYYRRSIEKWTQAQESLARLSSTQQVMRIACVSDLSMDDGLTALSDFCGTQYPGVGLVAERREPYELISLLTGNQIDIALCLDSTEFIPRSLLQLESEPICSLPSVLITNSRNTVHTTSLHQLLLLPCYICAVPGQSDGETESLFRQHWSRYGISFSTVRVLRNRDSVLSTVCFSNGIMVWVDGTEALHHPDTTAVPLPCAPIPLRAFWRKDERSLVARALVENLREYYTQHPLTSRRL